MVHALIHRFTSILSKVSIPFLTHKIWWTCHSVWVFLQVFVFQYHKYLRGNTNEPKFNGHKNYEDPFFLGSAKEMTQLL
jgi:hypothetical protein